MPDTSNAPPPPPQDALALLTQDQRLIDALFAEALHLEDGQPGPAVHADRSAILSRAGALLNAYTQIKRELFYPGLQRVGGDTQQAHDADDALLRQLQALSAWPHERSGYAAALRQLAEATRAQAAFDRDRLFPRLPQARRVELGTTMAARRAELLGDQGPD